MSDSGGEHVNVSKSCHGHRRRSPQLKELKKDLALPQPSSPASIHMLTIPCATPDNWGNKTMAGQSPL
jgi:hypothetical protein